MKTTKFFKSLAHFIASFITLIIHQLLNVHQISFAVPMVFVWILEDVVMVIVIAVMALTKKAVHRRVGVAFVCFCLFLTPSNAVETSCVFGFWCAVFSHSVWTCHNNLLSYFSLMEVTTYLLLTFT